MVRRLIASLVLAAVAACDPSTAYPPPAATPCPAGAGVCASDQAGQLRGFFQIIDYRGYDAALTYHLAQPSRVVMLDMAPDETFTLLDSAAAIAPLAAGEHTLTVARHLGNTTGGGSSMACYPVTRVIPIAGGQTESVQELGCSWGPSVFRPGLWGHYPILLGLSSWARVTLGRQLLFAIVADRPLTVAALRQAADSLDVPATMADVVRSFERRAHLPPGSAHWAVAEIATR